MEKNRKNTGSNALVTKGFLKKALEGLKLDIKAELRPIIDRLNDHEFRLVRIEERLENTSTKDQLDQVIKNMDFVMRSIKTFDDERTFDAHRIGILEDTSKVHSHDIKLLKLKVGV